MEKIKDNRRKKQAFSISESFRTPERSKDHTHRHRLQQWWYNSTVLCQTIDLTVQYTSPTGHQNSWACDSFIRQLFRWDGTDLYPDNWKSPHSLHSTITDTKWCIHTTCNMYLNVSDREATNKLPSHEHTTCRPASVLVHHKTCIRKWVYQHFVEDTIFVAENPKKQ